MEIIPQGRPNAAAAPHNKQSKVDTESEGSSLATASVVSSDLPNIRRGEHEGGEGEEYKGWWFRNLTEKLRLELFYKTFRETFPTFFLGRLLVEWVCFIQMMEPPVTWMMTSGDQIFACPSVKNPWKASKHHPFLSEIVSFHHAFAVQCGGSPELMLQQNTNQPTPSRSSVLFCDSLCCLLQPLNLELEPI